MSIGISNLKENLIMGVRSAWGGFVRSARTNPNCIFYDNYFLSRTACAKPARRGGVLSRRAFFESRRHFCPRALKVGVSQSEPPAKKPFGRIPPETHLAAALPTSSRGNLFAHPHSTNPLTAMFVTANTPSRSGSQCRHPNLHILHTNFPLRDRLL